jgi:ubiquinone/menaquinone biosynthesis C-methylase UbiE
LSGVDNSSGSVSFDRAADTYDRTRLLTGALATEGMAAVARFAPPGSRALEVGTGTGRIALPLLERGVDLVGCDLALGMLRRQRQKLPAARLVQADATALPFAAQRFDLLVTIHVMHLVGGWRQALREFRRVLAPGGVYLNSWNPHGGEWMTFDLRTFWRGRVEARGLNWRRPGIQSREELLDEARALGAASESLEAARALAYVTPREAVENIRRRAFSDTWDIPDEAFGGLLADLEAYAAERYPDPDRPYPEEHTLLLDVIRFH